MTKKKLVLNPKAKDRKKIIRSVIQMMIIVLLAIVLIRAFVPIDQYEDYVVERNNDSGFIALSYFGVSRGDSTKYVSKANLEKQLTLLAKQGYETITQQDIINFYEKGQPLPPKALYLSFEDGRTDSSIFAQNILEKLNLKATMFTYANKMDTRDTKFLKPNHLKQMERSGYWELGSNGYRLTYTNIYNDRGESLGVIDENDVPDKLDIEYYNHYLMDFIRDEYMIPSETRNEMEERIKEDYDFMEQIYISHFRKVPKAYAIMHANSLYNNMEPLVEKANDQRIKALYRMHFNREGEAYNDKDADIYNLSRLQVAPNWPTNHLMMRVQQSSQKDVAFEIGNQTLANKWTVKKGAAEFLNNEIILTSAPASEGVIYLNEDLPAQYEAMFTFSGNIVGEQSVFVNYDEQRDSYLRIMLKDNELFIFEKQPNGTETEIEHELLKDVSWSGEDYSFNKATVYSYKDTQEGSRVDEDEYPRNLKAKRQILIERTAETMKISVDRELSKTIALKEELEGKKIGFGAAHSDKLTDHEQYTDQIYDAIIQELEIKDQAGQLITTNQFTKAEKIKDRLSTRFNSIIDFFIQNF